ncbi:ADP-ribosylation factor-binding protein GGA2, partial [Orchesella cincta]
AEELCAFIIRLDRYTGCDFTLEESGVFNFSSDTITVFRISEQEEALPLNYVEQTTTPLRFPLNPNGGWEWDPVIITSGAKLITKPESTLQLMVYDFFVNPDCNSWFNVQSFDGTTAKFEGRVCGLDEKALTFNTNGLFIVLFYKSSISTEDYLGSMEWFETTTNITSQN